MNERLVVVYEKECSPLTTRNPRFVLAQSSPAKTRAMSVNSPSTPSFVSRQIEGSTTEASVGGVGGLMSLQGPQVMSSASVGVPEGRATTGTSPNAPRVIPFSDSEIMRAMSRIESVRAMAGILRVTSFGRSRESSKEPSLGVCSTFCGNNRE